MEASREKRLAATATALDFSYLVDIDRETGTARMRFDLDRDEQVSRRDGRRERGSVRASERARDESEDDAAILSATNRLCVRGVDATYARQDIYQGCSECSLIGSSARDANLNPYNVFDEL